MQNRPFNREYEKLVSPNAAVPDYYTGQVVALPKKLTAQEYLRRLFCVRRLRVVHTLRKGAK